MVDLGCAGAGPGGQRLHAAVAGGLGRLGQLLELGHDRVVAEEADEREGESVLRRHAAVLQAKLEELLGDERARRELADAAARAAAGPYSWDRAGEQTLALYRDLLS